MPPHGDLEREREREEREIFLTFIIVHLLSPSPLRSSNPSLSVYDFQIKPKRKMFSKNHPLIF